YELVRLVNGVMSVRSRAVGETFHPVIGPVAEAEALYVRQLHLAERALSEPAGLVLWDVGLGAAANVLTVLRALRDAASMLTVLSFDHTLEPLRFARTEAACLGYFDGYEGVVDRLLSDGEVRFENGRQPVEWRVFEGDFPSRLDEEAAGDWPKPHAVLFDAYSPARNPAMWTLPLFQRMHDLLDPGRACALPTYSRSTMLRVTLLLAGFFVGTGHPTGEKDQTTIAANRRELIDEPLDERWLQRAIRSTSAEPLREAVYRQAPLSADSLERLHRHPQFGGGTG
ncbi:MAG: hypothetical protein KDM81_00745, partial [Verrucomicrobiae bacterium]|nr:hypothetical protein [Verrucomicrobiae bacterium]